MNFKINNQVKINGSNTDEFKCIHFFMIIFNSPNLQLKVIYNFHVFLPLINY